MTDERNPEMDGGPHNYHVSHRDRTSSCLFCSTGYGLDIVTEN